MRALVVGADGFVGRWLVRHLAESGDVVIAVVGPRYRDREPLADVDRCYQVDVREYQALAYATAESKPDTVYYLAAVSQASSRDLVPDAVRIGLVGAIHALAACSALGNHVRFLQVSSAHVYGAGATTPLPEAAPVKPTSIYGAAKAASEQACLFLGEASGVDVVVARAFNHIGPGQASDFLVPSLAERVRAIPPATNGAISVGLPAMVRDYTDVRDVVRAYRLLATTGQAGSIYNVASGTGISMEGLVTAMAEVIGVSAKVSRDAKLARGGEPRVLIGDASRVEALGWTRAIPLRQTLAEILAEGP